jgi:DNA-binding transcriptional ArsR family regulator
MKGTDASSGRRREVPPGGASFGVVQDRGRAAALLVHPLRLKILEALERPDSASGVARRMRLPRQTVNYHVRALARANFLERAGRRKRRRLFEQCYVATARGYLLSPELLGGLAADPGRTLDRLSADYLLAVASTVQGELGRVAEAAQQAGKRLATLSMNTQIRFTSAEQRARFAAELQRATADVVRRHSAPFMAEDRSPGTGRPFRLVLGCYPIAEPVKENAEEN